MALTTAATGASFSPCFTLFRDGSWCAHLEGPDKAAAAEWHAPGIVEAIAPIGIRQRVGGHGVFQSAPGVFKQTDAFVEGNKWAAIYGPGLLIGVMGHSAGIYDGGGK